MDYNHSTAVVYQPFKVIYNTSQHIPVAEATIYGATCSSGAITTHTNTLTHGWKSNKD